MPPTNSNILSISLSRNRLGFAVFRYGQLDYYGVKTLNRYRSTRDRNRGVVRILDVLVKDHGIRELAFLKLNKQQRHSSELRSLYIAVRRFCDQNQLALASLDPLQMRKKLAGDDKPSKANVTIHLIEIFPELKRYSNDGSEWERRYYGHIFTAIGAGMVAVGFGKVHSAEGANQ